jgi:hypothetical protein
MLSSWLVMAMEGTRLAMEAQRVVALRLMKVAAGGAGARMEVARMMTEKAVAATEAAATMAMGGSRRKVVRGYRTRIRQNKRRLSKPARRS